MDVITFTWRSDGFLCSNFVPKSTASRFVFNNCCKNKFMPENTSENHDKHKIVVVNRPVARDILSCDWPLECA